MRWGDKDDTWESLKNLAGIFARWCGGHDDEGVRESGHSTEERVFIHVTRSLVGEDDLMSASGEDGRSEPTSSPECVCIALSLPTSLCAATA